MSLSPLRVLVLVKPNEANRQRERRQTGYFSYPVPEFTWEFDTAAPYLNTQRLRDKIDLVLVMDGAQYVQITGPVPTAALIWDSTGSKDHLRIRLEQAARVDLVLVDHDRLDRFKKTGKLVERCRYCVNDRVFNDYGVRVKINDIANHQNKGLQGHQHWQARNNLFPLVRAIAEARGYSYREGSLEVFKYARSYAESRVAVNFARTPTNRPHRVYDAIAAGACLVTTPLPSGADDPLIDGVHYLSFKDGPDMARVLDQALLAGQWEEIAKAGHDFVTRNHTWAVRARELRALLSDTLGV